MKTITLLLIVALTLFVVACTAPPSDVPSAQVVEEHQQADSDQPSDIMQDNPVVDDGMNNPQPVEPNNGIGDGAAPLPFSAAAINTDTSSFEFEGYAVGKSHIGTFNVWEGNLIYENDVLVGGSGIIQAASVDTGIEKLDAHLQNDDFFDVEMYPEISVEFLSISQSQATAELTFRGLTKTINFPVEVTGKSIQTDFLLDTTDFNMKYVGVNKEVRIAFEFNPVEG